MPIPSNITDLSTTPASNSPAGSENPIEGDNHIRTAYAFIRQLYDGVTGSAVATLETDLASTASASVGAGLVGLDFYGGTLRAFLAATYARTSAEVAAGVTPTNYAYRPLDPRRYGIDTTGAVDCTTAMQSVISIGGLIDLGSNTRYKVDSALLMDVRYCSMWGSGVAFDFSGGGSLQLFSSAAFPELVNTTRTALKGVRLIGPNTGTSSGLIIGRVGASYTQSSDIVVENCAFVFFHKLVEFTDNSWRSHFKNCRFEQPIGGGYFLYQPNTVSNSGEAMTFDHCAFYDSIGEIFVNVSQWNFVNGCSFGVECTLHAAGGSVVCLENPHFEAQPNAGYYMIHLADNANVSWHGGDMIINSGTNFEQPPIWLDGADTQLSIFGAYFPMNLGGYGLFENDTAFNLRDWVVGTGRLYAKGLQTSTASTLTGLGNNLNFSKLCNLLSNGDAEYNSTLNWTQATFGAGGSAVTATAGSKLNGTYGFNFATTAGGGVTFRQKIPIACAGQLVIASAPHQIITGTGTTGQLVLRFYDQSNTAITGTSITLNFASTDTAWTYGSAVAYAPQGTNFVEVEVNGQANAGAQQFYVDEICLNIL